MLTGAKFIFLYKWSIHTPISRRIGTHHRGRHEVLSGDSLAGPCSVRYRDFYLASEVFHRFLCNGIPCFKNLNTLLKF